MKTYLSVGELLLLVGLGSLCLLAVVAPPVAQNPAFHDFADARMFLGVPRAFDSLSNLGFLLLGAYGLWLVLKDRLIFFNSSMKASAITFFIGFMATAAGSTYYHLAPDNPGLALDRLGMVIAFAGMLGLAGAHRVSERAGWGCLVFGLLAGPASVMYWHLTGSLTPYVLVQYGGIGMACLMLLARAKGPGPYWWLMILSYGLAKYFEGHDRHFFEVSEQLVSGHTIKHLLATLPAVALIWPLRRKS